MAKLNTVKGNKGSTKRKKRVARGIASGSGKTSGRGHRGQKCRSGWSQMPHKEGGQTPLYRRLPKRQVNTRVNRKEFSIVNLAELQKLADAGVTEIDTIVLLEQGVINGLESSGLKILAKGQIKSAVNISADKFSEAAKAAIEAAGGKVLVNS